MRIFFFILIVFTLSSCKFFGKKKAEDRELAKAYDKTLFSSDIAGIIPPKTSAKDSIEIITNYINNWVREQVMLHKAEENLSSEKIDFTKQLADYKNSLTIYTYETELVKQKLDTNVSDNEINQYYEKHKDDFELKDNIVKVIYVKIPVKTSPKTVSILQQLYKSDNPKAKESLQNFCKTYAVNYYLDDESWLFFNDLLKEIPIQTYNQENYLQNNRLIELKDSLYQYFLNIKGFRIKESLSPLSFEKENIRKIIVNKRKVKMINDVHENLYQDALKNKDFEIFNTK